MEHTPPDTEDILSHPALAKLPDWFLHREVIPLEDHLALVVCHETMRRIVALCREIAESPAPVLLTGETGMSKSPLCRFIHASRDPYAPFVSFLAAGLEARVLEQRLFGGSPALGPESPELAGPETLPTLLDEAAGGTLVIEEMGDLPREIQLRLMEHWAGPGAGRGPTQWILTTNDRCAADDRCAAGGQGHGPQAEGTLLPEFLERFQKVHRIHVPPLRERRQDIPALMAYFSRLKTSRQASLKSLESLAARLSCHPFPGNVRELESLMTMEAGGLPWRWRVSGTDRSCTLDAGKASGRKKPAGKKPSPRGTGRK
jgi:DNA-binding NtrC family response regulator